jgi:threonine aldolase
MSSPRPIELRSDTFTLPTPAMMDAIRDAELGDDVYGEDPTVRRLEELAAARVGKDAAILMPSGTMANLASLMAHCPRGTTVLAGDQSDLFVYESAGPAVCGGLVLKSVSTEDDGRLSREALIAALSEDPDDPQFPRPSALCIETPHNRCGGVVLPISYLAELRATTRAHGLALHLDGARVFNAAVALGVPAADLTAHVDSLQLCLSKGLSAPIGSIAAGSASFVAQVRRIRKTLGGGMRQAGIVAAAGIVALEQMIDRLAEDHRHARLLAEGIAQLPGLSIRLEAVQTNMVLFKVIDPRFTLTSFIAAARERGVNLGELGRGHLRAALHAGVTRQDVDRTLEVLEDIVRGPRFART